MRLSPPTKQALVSSGNRIRLLSRFPTYSTEPTVPQSASAGGHAHVPELDGVRGLAILLTFAVHWAAVIGPGFWLDDFVRHVASFGGWGVDLFFVLSGFLITGILLSARERAASLGAYLRRFMWRRAVRIFPLYYVALFGLFVVVPRVIHFRDPAITALVHNQGWYWAYAVNWLYGLHPESPSFMTGHFWSLAVEEQFYLVWPLLVWWAGPRRLPLLAGSLWAVSVVLRFMLPASFDQAHLTTPVHLDPLMAGALLAWLATTDHWERATRWLRWSLLPLCGIVMLRSSLLAGALMLAALIAATLTLPLGHPVRTLSRGRTLRTFGKYSYCLYVVHYPLENVVSRIVPKLGLPHPFGSTLPEAVAFGLLLVGLSFAVALLSWRLLEQPALRLKDVVR